MGLILVVEMFKADTAQMAELFSYLETETRCAIGHTWAERETVNEAHYNEQGDDSGGSTK